jgi:hypothetical protein
MAITGEVVSHSIHLLCCGLLRNCPSPWRHAWRHGNGRARCIARLVLLKQDVIQRVGELLDTLASLCPDQPSSDRPGSGITFRSEASFGALLWSDQPASNKLGSGITSQSEVPFTANHDAS